MHLRHYHRIYKNKTMLIPKYGSKSFLQYYIAFSISFTMYYFWCQIWHNNIAHVTITLLLQLSFCIYMNIVTKYLALQFYQSPMPLLFGKSIFAEQNIRWDNHNLTTLSHSLFTNLFSCNSRDLAEYMYIYCVQGCMMYHIW